jgi:dTDP-4-dehydrorhamnose 3,5-epimerase
MQLQPTAIPGCFEIECQKFEDQRGSFVKTFQIEFFTSQGLRSDWREEYYSVSARNVVRGLHFQTPPADHAKLVYCVAGQVLDVVVDLRIGSPAFGKPCAFDLSAARANCLYLPAGVAHGFLSLADESILQYKVTSVYSPADDCGLLWSSIDYDWPVANPVTSERDASHPRLADYDSPFRYSPAA